MMPIASSNTTANRANIRNILYLTDFSDYSKAALPFAVALAKLDGATIHALHVLTPVIPESCTEAIEADEKLAESEMHQVDSRLSAIAHDTRIVKGMKIWPAIDSAVRDRDIDLVVLGTHGRTGAEKMLLGSVAEEIFRHSPVPVLTIGPAVRIKPRREWQLQRILFPTDFTPESSAAVPYVVSLAKENEACLVLLHVIRRRIQGTENEAARSDITVAEAFHYLDITIPRDAGLTTPPETRIQFGQPGNTIVEAAKLFGADLIVLGVRSAANHLGAATHLERATAHKVVAHAPCPVLTVRAVDAVQFETAVAPVTSCKIHFAES
jgi:nucleotide-binding universal stress UspA family protein